MSPNHLEETIGWITDTVMADASDLHLIPGYPPMMRLHGELKQVASTVIGDQDVRQFIDRFGPQRILERLAVERNVDFSFELDTPRGLHRFRTDVFFTEERLAACLRVVPPSIPDLDWAGFPAPLARKLAGLLDGLVIFTGITGSGKTTTLAIIIDLINRQGGRRIITVEEPIEYRFPVEKNSVVSQREVGTDVLSFSEGLRSGLRQDPDVILVGEIRDRDTAQMALSAAETGHLVFTTLHTRDAKGAISRYADLFPQDVQVEIRSQLALGLRAIICQRLLPDILPGNKRHLALEILWNTYPIASAIRQGKLESIDNYLLTRRDDGMLSFDESVRQLLEMDSISRQVAELNVRDPSFLNKRRMIDH